MRSGCTVTDFVVNDLFSKMVVGNATTRRMGLNCKGGLNRSLGIMVTNKDFERIREVTFPFFKRRGQRIWRNYRINTITASRHGIFLVRLAAICSHS